MKLTSINIGQAQTQQNGEKLGTTGIYKSSIHGPVKITTPGITEDFIGSPKHHGGPDQAVYVYGAADYAWWSRELGWDLAPGTFSNNLTINDMESDMRDLQKQLKAQGVERMSEADENTTDPQVLW